MNKEKNSLFNNIKIWKRLIKYLKPYKIKFVLLIICMICLGIIDAFLPYMTKYGIDNFVNTKSLSGFNKFVTIYIILVSLLGFFVYSFSILGSQIENQLIYDLRKKTFEKLQRLSLSYYDKNSIGSIMSKTISDVSKLSSNIIWSLVDIFGGFSMMIGIAAIMFTINPKLATLSLLTVPVVMGVSIFFQKKMLIVNRAVRQINSLITGAYTEGILGAMTSKVLVREEKNIREFNKLSENMRIKSIKSVKFSSFYLPLVVSIGSLGTALVLVYGGKAVDNNIVSYGTLILFISYTYRFFEPIEELAVVFSSFQSAQAALERVVELVEKEPSIIDRKDVIEKYGNIFEQKKENWEKIQGEIEFKNINFEYGNNQVVLQNFNLKVKKGENIAFVGETGSGKSTIVNLLCRFYEPNSGKILIDGIDYRDRSQSWLHSQLGYVLQTPHLFSGSILENICYGSENISRKEAIEAAKFVNAHNFIMKLKNNYDTEVGEGGSTLSTGEKQLISFARAIISKPKLFVLDEATSNIDTETEQLIQKSIYKMLEGRTSFIIAHRLSTIRNADRILVINNGKIVESGNHKELLARKSKYYRLYMKQFNEEKEIEILGKDYRIENLEAR